MHTRITKQETIINWAKKGIYAGMPSPLDGHPNMLNCFQHARQAPALYEIIIFEGRMLKCAGNFVMERFTKPFTTQILL